MIAAKYEHHTLIQTNNSFPFILRFNKACNFAICNWHRNIELLMFESGEGQVQYGLRQLPVAPGDIVIINSNAMHSISSAGGVNYHYLIIDHAFCSNNGIDIEKLLFVEKTRSSTLRNVCYELISETEKAKSDMSLASIAAVRRATLSVLIELCTGCLAGTAENSGRTSTSEELVKSAMIYIGDHCTEPVKLDDLAATLSVSASHLARIFKKHTGQTIITYTNTLRCQKAAQCIASGMNITEAALESGFETLSYFSRTYKKLTGVSPSTLRP